MIDWLVKLSRKRRIDRYGDRLFLLFRRRAILQAKLDATPATNHSYYIDQRVELSGALAEIEYEIDVAEQSIQREIDAMKTASEVKHADK